MGLLDSFSACNPSGCNILCHGDLTGLLLLFINHFQVRPGWLLLLFLQDFAWSAFAATFEEQEVCLISCRHAAWTTKNVIGWHRTAAADCCPVRLLLFWQSGCWSCCLRPVVTGCCRPSLHVSVRQALSDLSSAWGLPAPRRGPSLHHIPSNYWHPAAFEHTGIIVKNSRGQTADGEGWKQQSLK